MRPGWRLLVAAAVLACRPARPPAPPPAPPPRPVLQVEKVREVLRVTPLEAVFSVVRGEPPADEFVGIRNTGEEPVQLVTIEVVGSDAEVFKIVSAPKLPLTLLPAAQVSVTIAFAPSAAAEARVHRATLRILVGPRGEDGQPVDLSGLVLAGRMGDKEPPLQRIVEALGFATDVGGRDLKLGNEDRPLGDEVPAPLFKRARRSPVSIYPVARFSPDGSFPYGYYTDGPASHPLAAIAAGQLQTLNPDLEPDGKTTFDPADAPFGLYLSLGRFTLHTDDRLNAPPVRHAFRAYPLRSRAGGRIPDAFLIAVETTGDSDYQDAVFVIWNVKVAE
jgi:hypothetical protein